MSNQKSKRCLFPGKNRTDTRFRVQGILTPDGTRAFEMVRQSLQERHDMPKVSDGDTIEYLAREAVTRRR